MYNGSGEGEGHFRPQLLFLCQTLPFPADGGVHIRTYNILRMLAEHFEITALCFYRRATRPHPESIRRGVEGLSRFASVEAFEIPQERTKRRLVLDHLRSVAFGQVYTRYVYDSPEFHERLLDVTRSKRFDLVHLDSLDLSAYLPMLNVPVVCTHHNVESDLLARRAATERSALRRTYLRLQSRLMRQEERKWCPQVDLNACVSTADAERLRDIAPTAPTIVVPNGVDTTYFQPRSSDEESGLVFVGGHSWYPNRDGMEYFVREIMPLIRHRHPQIRLTWVGRVPEALQELQSGGVDVTGYVDDIREYVQRSACYIAPLRVGGGTRLKILDAWAMGKAIVSTSVACEGLDAEDGHNILIADSPQDFADAVHAVLTDRELRKSLGAAARVTAEQKYEWSVIGVDMVRRYFEVIGLDGPHYDATNPPTTLITEKPQ